MTDPFARAVLLICGLPVVALILWNLLDAIAAFVDRIGGKR